MLMPVVAFVTLPMVVRRETVECGTDMSAPRWSR
jgi:hypothetical protein